MKKMSELNRINSIDLTRELSSVNQGKGTFKEILDLVYDEIIIPLTLNGEIVGFNYNTRTNNVLRDNIEKAKFMKKYAGCNVQHWVETALYLKSIDAKIDDVNEDELGITVYYNGTQLLDVETYYDDCDDDCDDYEEDDDEEDWDDDDDDDDDYYDDDDDYYEDEDEDKENDESYDEILTEKEKKKLEKNIAPFKEAVLYVYKSFQHDMDGSSFDLIKVEFVNGKYCVVASDWAGYSYKGMKEDKKYSLRELGLFENSND